MSRTRPCGLPAAFGFGSDRTRRRSGRRLRRVPPEPSSPAHGAPAVPSTHSMGACVDVGCTGRSSPSSPGRLPVHGIRRRSELRVGPRAGGRGAPAAVGRLRHRRAGGRRAVRRPVRGRGDRARDQMSNGSCASGRVVAALTRRRCTGKRGAMRAVCLVRFPGGTPRPDPVAGGHRCPACVPMFRRPVLPWFPEMTPFATVCRLLAADGKPVEESALQAPRRVSFVPGDPAHNVTVYYANDDWAFSTVTRRHGTAEHRLGQAEPADRRLGQAEPADLSATNNVYAVDCDDVHVVDGGDHSRDAVPGSTYFLAEKGNPSTLDSAVADGVKRDSGRREPEGAPTTPGPVVTHLLHALQTGCVDADSVTRTRVLGADIAGNGRE